MQKIGIYSGTFDPVHAGHVAFAEAAVKRLKLAKVFFMVEPRPRRKQGVKAFEHRARMVQLAIADNPKLGSIILDQQRFSSSDTLPVLLERFRGAELCLLIGDDMIGRLAAWPQVDDLLRQVSFVIGLRKLTRPQAEQQIEQLLEAFSVKLRYTLIDTPQPAISSSHIKRALRQKGDSEGIPKTVGEYIASNGLYSATSAASENSS